MGLQISNFQSHITRLRTLCGERLCNYNCHVNKNEMSVTWSNFKRMDRTNKEDLYSWAVAERQYSAMIAHDGSLLQFYYQFDRKTGRNLTSASLAYIKNSLQASEEHPQEADLQVDEVAELEILSVLETMTEPVKPVNEVLSTTWIRIDYDPVARSIDPAHYFAHLHCSLGQDTRIPVLGIPTPIQFVDLVMCWFYPSMFREMAIENHPSQSRRYLDALHKDRMAYKDFDFEHQTSGLTIVTKS